MTKRIIDVTGGAELTGETFRVFVDTYRESKGENVLSADEIAEDAAETVTRAKLVGYLERGHGVFVLDVPADCYGRAVLAEED